MVSDNQPLPLNQRHDLWLLLFVFRNVRLFFKRLKPFFFSDFIELLTNGVKSYVRKSIVTGKLTGKIGTLGLSLSAWLMRAPVFQSFDSSILC